MSQAGGPGAAKLRVFISYSRYDVKFALTLFGALEARGLQPAIDTRDLPKLEDWRRELLGFIRESDAVVFILSPRSAASEVCAWEVEQAASLSKRLAPVVLERVPDSLVPDALGRINYLEFTDISEFESQFDALASALVTDIAWIKEHTRLGEVSRRWHEDGEPKVRLLRGGDIDAAERWASRRPMSAPQPTETAQRFIEESRTESNLQAKRSRLRSRLLSGASLTVALIIGSLGWFYYQQWQSGQLALSQARFQQGQWTARDGHAEQSAAFFADALKVNPANEAAQVGLYNQLAEKWHPFVHRRIEVGPPVRTLTYLPDGSGLLAATDSEVLLFRSDTDTAPAIRLKHEEVEVRHAQMDPTGRRILTTATTYGSIVEAPYGVIRLWDASSGQLLASKRLPGVVGGALFTPSGEIVVSTAFRPIVLSGDLERETVDLGSTLDRGRHRTRNAPTSMHLSTDGQRLLWGVGAMEPAFYVWNLPTRSLLYRSVSSASFSDLYFALDGTKVAFAGPDKALLGGLGSPKVGYVALQGANDAEPVVVADSRDAELSVAQVDATGTFLVAAFEDKTVRVVGLGTGRMVANFQQQAVVSTTVFSHDALMIGIGDREGRIRILDTLGTREPSAAHLQGGSITAIAFSPIAPRMASASADGSIVIWDTATTLASELVLETGRPRMREVALVDSTESRLLMQSDGRVELWDALNGRQVSELLMDTSRLRIAATSGPASRALLVGEGGPMLVSFEGESMSRVPVDLPTGATMGEFDVSGTRLVVAAKDRVQVVNPATGSTLLRIDGLPNGSDFFSARFLESGKRLLVVSRHRLAIWDIESGREVESKEHGARRQYTVLDNDRLVNQDEQRIAVDAQVARDGDRIVVLYGREGVDVRAPAYRPNVVLEGAQVWSLPALRPIGPPINAGGDVQSSLLSASGHLSVSASEGRAIFIATSTSAALREPVVTDFPVFHSAVSPGDSHVALYGRAPDVLLIDVRNRRAPPRRLIHDGSVVFASFLQGGEVLVTVAADGMARLWDVREGTVIGAEIRVGGADGARLALSGQLLVTRMDAGVVKVRRLQMPAK